MAKSRHWTEQVADRVEQQARRHKGAGATIVCASGVSPSGPIHLGNLREVMTVHLVSEELRSRRRLYRTDQNRDGEAIRDFRHSR